MRMQPRIRHTTEGAGHNEQAASAAQNKASGTWTQICQKSRLPIAILLCHVRWLVVVQIAGFHFP
eukprot:3667720-Prymnesium_polylepis.1